MRNKVTLAFVLVTVVLLSSVGHIAMSTRGESSEPLPLERLIYLGDAHQPTRVAARALMVLFFWLLFPIAGIVWGRQSWAPEKSSAGRALVFYSVFAIIVILGAQLYVALAD